MIRAYIDIPRRFDELPPGQIDVLLRRLADTPAVRDAIDHFGTDRRVSDTYHLRLALRLVDPVMPAGDRKRLAKRLLPIAKARAPVRQVVPNGCVTTPVPDLTRGFDRIAFMHSLVTDQETGCWNRKGDHGGKHPRIRIDGRLYSTHRVAYTLWKGPIPVGSGYHGTVVRHTCDNPACCNPDHLVLGTQRDNVLDMVGKGRGGFCAGQGGAAR